MKEILESAYYIGAPGAPLQIVQAAPQLRNLAGGHFLCPGCADHVYLRIYPDRRDHFAHGKLDPAAPPCVFRETHATTVGGASRRAPANCASFNLRHCVRTHRNVIFRYFMDIRRTVYQLNGHYILPFATPTALQRAGQQLLGVLMNSTQATQPATSRQSGALAWFRYSRTQRQALTRQEATVLIFEFATLYYYANQHPQDFLSRFRAML